MASFDQRQVVGRLVGVGPEAAGRGRRRRDVEAARHRDHRFVVAVALEVLDAKGDRDEEGGLPRWIHVRLNATRTALTKLAPRTAVMPPVGACASLSPPP